MVVHMDVIAEILGAQGGVVSRRQVLAAGLNNAFIERKLRRRVWARVHRGVYVAHTGHLSWEQRAWAAILCFWPAALSHGSALTAHHLNGHARGPGVPGARSSPRTQGPAA